MRELVTEPNQNSRNEDRDVMPAQRVHRVARHLSPIHQRQEKCKSDREQTEEDEAWRPDPSQTRNHSREQPVRIEEAETTIELRAEWLVRQNLAPPAVKEADVVQPREEFRQHGQRQDATVLLFEFG